jgi:site-specific recombinase
VPLPKAQHRLDELHPWASGALRPARTARFARYIEHNLGALPGNLSFGFVLGGVGFIGLLTGLPTAFRARHVRYERAGLVLRLVLKRLLRRPHDFVWPPRAAGAGQT